LAGCDTCSHPVFTDDRIFPFCYTEKTTDRKVCKLRCGDGQSDLKGLKNGDIKCDCGKSACRWKKGSGKKEVTMSNMRCVSHKRSSVLIREKVECAEKPPGCFDIWEDVTLIKTWSCQGEIL
jgi:hypothetical protein